MPKVKTTEGASVTRLPSIPLASDGNIDWSSVRPSTASTFLNLIENDPKIREHIAELNGSGGGDDAPDLFGGITQENVKAGLDILSQVNALVFRIGAARFMKSPVLRDANNRPLPLVIEPDILEKSFSLTEEQHKELDPRATKIVQKYSGNMPEWAKKHLDVIMFVSMYLKYTSANAQAAIVGQIGRDQTRLRKAHEEQTRIASTRTQPDSDVRRTPPPPQKINGRARVENFESLEPGHVDEDSVKNQPPPETPTV